MPTLKLLLFHQRGVGVLLFNYFLMNAGFYLLIPFVALHGTRDLGLSAAAAGLVLAVRQFIQQGLTIFGGALGDRIGYRPTLALGVLIRAFGFAAFAFARDLPSLIFAAALAAFGGVFFESTSKAALAALTPSEHRAAGFSLYGVASRLGSAVGPALGVLLLQIDFALVGLVAALLYVACFASFMLLMPAVAAPRATSATLHPSLAQTFTLALRDRRLVWFVALNAGYWFLFTQFTITLPLYSYRVFGGLEAVSGYYVVNSLPAVFLQYPLLQRLNRHWSASLIMLVGMAFIALGIGTIGLWSLPLLVIASASVYAFGDLLYQPTQQTVISDMARPEVLGAYFGFASFALAIGGGFGNLFGGALFDLALANGIPQLLWYGYGMMGVLLVIGLALWSRANFAATTLSAFELSAASQTDQ